MGFARHDRLAHCLLPVLLMCLFPFGVEADGGAVRLSERKGNYQITVFTAPTPLRAGTIDVSVLVQNALTQELASDVQVTIGAKPRGHPGHAMRQPATAEGATNKLFRATTFELRSSGWWEFVVSIDHSSKSEQVQFGVDVADPLPKYQTLWAWIGWPVVPILLFAIHQCLVRRVSIRSLNG